MVLVLLQRTGGSEVLFSDVQARVFVYSPFIVQTIFHQSCHVAPIRSLQGCKHSLWSIFCDEWEWRRELLILAIVHPSQPSHPLPSISCIHFKREIKEWHMEWMMQLWDEHSLTIFMHLSSCSYECQRMNDLQVSLHSLSLWFIKYPSCIDIDLDVLSYYSFNAIEMSTERDEQGCD